MNRNEFISFLESNSCVVVRNDKKGYSVLRNVLNGEISGVPKEETIYNATICRICKSLEIDPPDTAKSAQGIVDLAHRNHGKKDK